MTISQITVNTAGQIDVNPRIIKIVCDNSLAEVTAAGFLNQEVLPAPLIATDLVLLAYDEDISFFTVSISTSGVITLSVNTDIPDGSITTAKLAANAVTTAKLNDLAVTEDKLATDSVTAEKLADNVVVTAKIEDGNVTNEKLSTDLQCVGALKYLGKYSNAGGSATVTIPSLVGMTLADYNADASIQSSANAVTIQKVTPGTDQLVILCSGDPGVSVISYRAWSAV
jgi:hypothetical protein